MSDLLDRLREVEWSGKDRGRKANNGTTCWHRNPEGPEAAKEIERLREQVREWIKENGPGGWINDLREQVADLYADSVRLEKECVLKDRRIKELEAAKNYWFDRCVEAEK